MELMRERIRVGPGYDVLVGEGLLDTCGTYLQEAVGNCRMAVITDSNVGPLYLDRTMEGLRRGGYRDTVAFAFPAGEGHKRLSTVGEMLEFLAEAGLTRGDCLLALGGGVTGDMAGFAAGCYLRGVRFGQLPTTLLAAVDSSVGGKTGVDLPAGKNLAGLFHQPALVLCDIAALDTLPREILADGAAEAVKTGILAGEPLFSLTEAGVSRERLGEIILGCVRYKGEIVGADPLEGGRRKLLNLGHTLGHALEQWSGYTISHGQGVAVGTAVMTRAAVAMGLCSRESGERILRALARSGLPTGTDAAPDVLARGALSDKKRTGEAITLVLPYGVGDCRLVETPVRELARIFSLGMEALP